MSATATSVCARLAIVASIVALVSSTVDNSDLVSRFCALVTDEMTSAASAVLWASSRLSLVASIVVWLERSISLSPHFSMPHAGLAYIAYVRAAWGMTDDINAAMARALEHGRKAIELDSRSAFAWSVMGRILMLTGKIGDAFAHQRRALELNPSFAYAYFGLAQAHMWAGEHEQAIDLYRMVLDSETPGTAQHPSPHDFLITSRAPDHPIMKGLPAAWLHANDELYSNLRGPAKNVTVLATAIAPTSMPNGTGEHEPLLMAISYGKGRVFHDTLGHVGATQKEPIIAMNSVDYIVLLQRGTEWAATGSVTIPVPKDFPTADKTSVR